MTQMIDRKYTSLVAFLLALGISGSALAGPWPTKSGIAASAEDATAAGDNPAAMTRFDARAIQVGVYGFFSESTFEGTSSGTGATFVSESDGTTVIPSGSLVMPFGKNWWFGMTALGVGFSEDFGEDWIGRYIIQDYTLAYVSLYPSIATKLTDKLSVAGSLMLTYTIFEQNKAVPNVLDPGVEDGSLNLDSDGWTAGWSVSMLYEFNERTRMGFVYRSELDPDLDADLNWSGLGPNTQAFLDSLGLLNGSASVTSRSPQSANIGIHHDFENLHSLAFDIVWIDFSNFQLSEIYFNGNTLFETDPIYEDITGIAIGYNFPVSERVRLGLGAFVTDEMIEDENRTMILRLDTATSYGVGVQWTTKKGTQINANLSYLDFGEAPVTSPDLPVVGVISGEYTKRDTIYLQVSAAFGNKPR